VSARVCVEARIATRTLKTQSQCSPRHTDTDKEMSGVVWRELSGSPGVEGVELLEHDKGEDSVRTEAGVVWQEPLPQCTHPLMTHH
jgi:hypothetical protein